MKTTIGMRVQIQAPPKFKSFGNTFNGLIGTVIGKGDGKYGRYETIKINLNEKDEAWINVDPDWLKRPPGILRRPRLSRLMRSSSISDGDAIRQAA